MDKNIDVSFSYGDKEFDNIIKKIVKRKLDLYKTQLINREQGNETSQEEQFSGRHNE